MIKYSFFLINKFSRHKKIIIKIIIFLLFTNVIKKGIFFELINIIYFNFRDKVKKVCLCSPAKNENRYIREFIKYYLKYGVDKIIIYDNNDINGERIENVIKSYIKSGSVEIINYRGKENAQLDLLNDCYSKNYNKYDWLFFFDIDEFLFLKNYTNVKTYLNNIKLYKCKKIYFNWVRFTDNNLLYYDNRPLLERFIEREPKITNSSKNPGIKTIIKGHLKYIKRVDCQHRITLKLKACDGFGNIESLNNIKNKEEDYENYYIKHFYCKSTEEFINST